MTGTIQQAAAEIVALINSRPNTPSEAKIAAAIGRIGTGALAAMSPAHAELYRDWRGLIEENIREFEGDDEHLSEAEQKAEEERLAAHLNLIDDLEERILETPARTWGDILAHAEVGFWRHWAGVDPQGPDADAQMQGGPFSMGEACDEASPRCSNRSSPWRGFPAALGDSC
jgi:hypothetical protein